MKKNENCPLCDSTDIKLTIENAPITEPFTRTKLVPIKNYICNNCGFEGDFYKENDDLLEKEINQLKIISAKSNIEYLLNSHKNISMSSQRV